MGPRVCMISPVPMDSTPSPLKQFLVLLYTRLWAEEMRGTAKSKSLRTDRRLSHGVCEAFAGRMLSLTEVLHRAAEVVCRHLIRRGLAFSPF